MYLIGLTEAKPPFCQQSEGWGETLGSLEKLNSSLWLSHLCHFSTGKRVNIWRRAGCPRGYFGLPIATACMTASEQTFLCYSLLETWAGPSGHPQMKTLFLWSVWAFTQMENTESGPLDSCSMRSNSFLSIELLTSLLGRVEGVLIRDKFLGLFFSGGWKEVLTFAHAEPDTPSTCLI